MWYHNMIREYASEASDNSKLKAWFDTTFKNWHLRLHLILCVRDLNLVKNKWSSRSESYQTLSKDELYYADMSWPKGSVFHWSVLQENQSECFFLHEKGHAFNANIKCSKDQNHQTKLKWRNSSAMRQQTLGDEGL